MRFSEGDVVSISCRFLTSTAKYDLQQHSERGSFFLFLFLFIPPTKPFVILQSGPQVSHTEQERVQNKSKDEIKWASLVIKMQRGPSYFT